MYHNVDALSKGCRYSAEDCRLLLENIRFQFFRFRKEERLPIVRPHLFNHFWIIGRVRGFHKLCAELHGINVPIKFYLCLLDKFRDSVSFFTTDTIQINVVTRFGSLVDCKELVDRDVYNAVHADAVLFYPVFNSGEWKIRKLDFEKYTDAQGIKLLF